MYIDSFKLFCCDSKEKNDNYSLIWGTLTLDLWELYFPTYFSTHFDRIRNYGVGGLAGQTSWDNFRNSALVFN